MLNGIVIGRVTQYVLDLLVEAAKRLLASEHFSLGEVAVQTGFADQSHLARDFKQRAGLAPVAVDGALPHRRTRP